MKSISIAAAPSKRLALILAAAVAAGCASGRATTTTTSGGDVVAGDTAGRVAPATGGISPTANPPVLGPGATGAPQPGTPAVASRDNPPGATTMAAGAAGAAAATSGGNMGAMDMSAGGPAMGARSDANIVALLHESNVGEIQAGTLAQQRVMNASVRSFAQQMVTEHTALDARGSSLATQAGIMPALPDSTLPRQNQVDLATLRNASSGSAFDRAYINQQVVAHQKTLALVDAAISMTQNAPLRSMLQSEVRPRVADHLRMAQQLQGQVGTAP